MITNDSPITETEARMLPPLTLAYMGDCIYDLIVREALIKASHLPNGGLHNEAKKYVSAHGQSALAEKLTQMLNSEEEAVYRRGRNSHALPNRNIDPAEYHKATGVEALFGYLYLTGNTARIYELFAAAEGELHEEKGTVV